MLVMGKPFLQTPLTSYSESLAPSLPIYSDLGRSESASRCGPRLSPMPPPWAEELRQPWPMGAQVRRTTCTTPLHHKEHPFLH